MDQDHREERPRGSGCIPTHSQTYICDDRTNDEFFTNSKVDPSGVVNRSRWDHQQTVDVSITTGRENTLQPCEESVIACPPGACEGFHHKAEYSRGVGTEGRGHHQRLDQMDTDTTPVDHFSFFKVVHHHTTFIYCVTRYPTPHTKHYFRLRSCFCMAGVTKQKTSHPPTHFFQSRFRFMMTTNFG